MVAVLDLRIAAIPMAAAVVALLISALVELHYQIES
jgi:hypothetical protein